MFSKAFRKILKVIVDRPLPLPSKEELVYIKELQDDFLGMPVVAADNPSPSELQWNENINRLREHVLHDNPRKFLRWDVILATMFVEYASYIATELKYLRHSRNWDKYWQRAIKESFVGHPFRYIYYPVSSGNLIHHTYHLLQFEERTSACIRDLKYVFEFGGGYGGMCRLFSNLGFRGKYIIFDFPSFSALQRYYLKTSGIPVPSMETFKKSTGCAFCISDSDLLINLLAECTPQKDSLFMATWSISESPIVVRDRILPLAEGFNYFLIAYQDRFEEVDNISFFDKWKGKISGVDWCNWPIEHMPGNNYLIGEKR